VMAGREPLGPWDLCSSRKPRLSRAPFDLKPVKLRRLYFGGEWNFSGAGKDVVTGPSRRRWKHRGPKPG